MDQRNPNSDNKGQWGSEVDAMDTETPTEDTMITTRESTTDASYETLPGTSKSTISEQTVVKQESEHTVIQEFQETEVDAVLWPETIELERTQEEEVPDSDLNPNLFLSPFITPRGLTIFPPICEIDIVLEERRNRKPFYFCQKIADNPKAWFCKH